MMGVVNSAQNTDGATQDESLQARKRAREDADDTAASGGQAPTTAGDETSVGDMLNMMGAWADGYNFDGYGSNLLFKRGDAEFDADLSPVSGTVADAVAE